jgi:ribosomal protein S3
MGRRRHESNFKNPQTTTTIKEKLPMIVIGLSGIKVNKMVGHIQHILNVQAYKVATIQT